MLEVILIAGAIALGLLFADQISKLIVSGFVKSLNDYKYLLELAQPKLLAIIYKVQLPRLKCQFIIQKIARYASE